MDEPEQLGFWPRLTRRKRPRPPDPLWNTWVELWGEPATKNERGRVNQALGELREIDATPDQLRTVLRRYDREFAGCARSPQGVTGNWTLLLNSQALREITRRGESLCPHGIHYMERCQECIDA
jgi:hypothetical protein